VVVVHLSPSKSFALDVVNSIENQTAIDCLSLSCPQISNKKLKLAMQYGAVWLTPNGKKAARVRKVKKILSKGDKLSIYYDEKILFSPIPSAQLISDEGEYSVWNKPSGMFSQGTKWGDHSSIARWVELFGLAKYNLDLRPTFLVHRLDRATSGIILVAHSKKMAASLSFLFEHRQIEKQYEAVVKGEFPSELISQPILDEIDGKSATTIVLSSKYDPSSRQSRLLVKIETGRKHQIRKHLANRGFPIIGDRFYGDDFLHEVSVDYGSYLETEINTKTKQPDLMLKSCYLSFTCPMTQIKQEYKI